MLCNKYLSLEVSLLGGTAERDEEMQLNYQNLMCSWSLAEKQNDQAKYQAMQNKFGYLMRKIIQYLTFGDTIMATSDTSQI